MRLQVFPTAEEWKNKRPYQIGASEVSTIVGVSKYGSISELWDKKVNEVVDNEENKAMQWGHYFEDGVAKIFEERTGLEVIKSSVGDWQFVNAEKPWMTCSPDRTYWLNSNDKNAKDWSKKGLLECKTSVTDPEAPGNEWMLKSWYCQIQWQLLVAEMEEAHLCCAVFGFERKEIIRHWPADKEFQRKILKIVKDFWETNVLMHVPPTPRTKEDVLRLFPSHVEGKTVEADDDVFSLFADLKSLKENIKLLKEKEEELTSKVAIAIGDAERLEYAGDVIATYKQNKSSLKFDEKKFRTEYPELYAGYCNEVAGPRVLRLK